MLDDKRAAGVHRSPPRHADAIVVLGCRGRAALDRRLHLGIRLFEEGVAPLIVLSGGGPGPVPEAEHMRRSALASGMPETALLIDAVSRNTFENAREAARLLRSRGLSSVVLVSDRTHLLRAAILFRLTGLRVVRRIGAPSPSHKIQVRATIREVAALPWSLLRALFSRLRRSRLNGGKPGRHAPK